MINYSFAYSDASGGIVRWTSMQCLSDAEAIAKARDTMQDKYAALEIFAGERPVYAVAPVRT